MNKRWKIGAAVVVGLGLVGVGVAGHAWYYDRYLWPQRIQVELMGEAVATHESLRAYEGEAVLGQGSFRWTYDLSDRASAALSKLCAPQDVKRCRFSKSGRPEEHVETSVTYAKGTMVVEEGWL